MASIRQLKKETKKEALLILTTVGMKYKKLQTVVKHYPKRGEWLCGCAAIRDRATDFYEVCWKSSKDKRYAPWHYVRKKRHTALVTMKHKEK